MSGVHAGESVQEWETPQHIVDAIVRDSFGGMPFALDAAASELNAKAVRFCDVSRSGLVRSWSDATWCNPPYRHQGDWLEWAWLQARQGVNSACLVLASTSANYWPGIMGRATVDLFRGRISFIHPATRQPVRGNAYASALVLQGPRFSGGIVRYRDASTGELVRSKRSRLVDVRRGRALPVACSKTADMFGKGET